MNVSTDFVHAGCKPEPVTGSILTPIFMSTTYVQDSVEEYLSKGYSYSRVGNPTVSAMESKIAQLEGVHEQTEDVIEKDHNSSFTPVTELGHCNAADSETIYETLYQSKIGEGGATCFNTGMAAVFAVFSAFLKPGDHCILTACSYGGTNRCARVHFSKYGIKFDFVDFTDLKNIEKCISKDTRMIFSESPTNPTLTVCDVYKISQLCKKYSLKLDECSPVLVNDGQPISQRILHVCDSTLATPILLKPLLLGCDIVVHSSTKYFDGHNCGVGGAVVCSRKSLDDAVKLQRNICGSIMHPFTAYMTLVTIKTLPLRFIQQSSNALRIAKVLEKHKNVKHVCYPGLENYKCRGIYDKQVLTKNLYGNMVSFELLGGTEKGIKFMNTIRSPWSLCENLGSCESLITYPRVFTHANMTEEDRHKVGITDGLIRLSVGIEDANDLIKSLLVALDEV